MARTKDQTERRCDLVNAATRAIVSGGGLACGWRHREEAGLSPSLVSYYYRNLDDLSSTCTRMPCSASIPCDVRSSSRSTTPRSSSSSWRTGVSRDSEDDLVCRVLYELHLHGGRSRTHGALMTSLWEHKVSLYELVIARGVECGEFTVCDSTGQVAESAVARLHVVGPNASKSVADASKLLVRLLERETGRDLPCVGVQPEAVGGAGFGG